MKNKSYLAATCSRRSIVWLIIGLHTTHVLTDVADTLALTVLMFTRHGHGRRFSDVSDNAFYWCFVIASWPPIAVVYLLPRQFFDAITRCSAISAR